MNSKENKLRAILGKHIIAVIHAQFLDSSPREQLFLVFDDGTNYELYGNDFEPGGLSKGDQVAVVKSLADRPCQETQVSL